MQCSSHETKQARVTRKLKYINKYICMDRTKGNSPRGQRLNSRRPWFNSRLELLFKSHKCQFSSSNSITVGLVS